MKVQNEENYEKSNHKNGSTRIIPVQATCPSISMVGDEYLKCWILLLIIRRH